VRTHEPSQRLTAYADGGSRGNPGPAAIGVVICTEADRVVQEHSEYIGRATNNEAEYCALIKGMELAGRHTHGEVLCIMDSEFVVKQVEGSYRVKDRKLKRLREKVKDKERTFERVEYRHLPRLTGRLARADELVNEALDNAGF